MAQPTMADIARHLGISRPLVSIVLRDAPGAGPETRDRVLQAARELGYTPHQGARSLRQTRSQHLGVSFVPVHASEPEIVEAVYAAAAERGYQVVLSAQTPTRDQPRTVEELLSYRCAAVLLLGSELGSARLRSLAERAAVPTVLVGASSRNPVYDVVRSAGDHGIAAAVTHLAGLGHRRLAYIHCPALPSGRSRLRGFTGAAARLQLTTEIVEITGRGYTEEAGSEAARRLLGAPELPTGLVAGNDQQAVGALWVLARAGVAVPADISLTGFDDNRLARLSGVDLTTARQDPEQLGRAAVEAALRRVEEPALPTAFVAVEPVLQIRSSTGPPRA